MNQKDMISEWARILEKEQQLKDRGVLNKQHNRGTEIINNKIIRTNCRFKYIKL